MRSPNHARRLLVERCVPRQGHSVNAVTALALTLAGVALSAQPASAAVIFNNIADTTTTAPGHGAFTFLSTPPSVSGSNVAFRGGYSGGAGIYTGSVGATGAAKVVDSGDFNDFGAPSVSGSNLAFLVVHEVFNGQGIYTGSVGATGATKIVESGDTAGGGAAFADFFGNPSVSGSNVAFLGYYNDGNSSGIYTGTVGATGATKVVDRTDTAPGHGAFTVLAFPSVSGSNVAFLAEYLGGDGIYTGSVGAIGAAKVVDTTDTAPGHGPFTFFADPPSISGSNLAFRGGYNGGSGIYTGRVGVTGAAKVVDLDDTAPGHGAFTAFGATPSVSGSNVAFVGGYSGGSGIYLASGGAGGSLSAVLNSGDPLFGSTVTGLDMGSFAYDNDAIAFSYTLANGRSGIAVAIISEPVTPPPGDFNRDGTVDAADYVVWRKTDNTQAGYNLWRANFGQPPGGGSSSALHLPTSPFDTAVPEPALLVLCAWSFWATSIAAFRKSWRDRSYFRRSFGGGDADKGGSRTVRG
jgi:hypothetical protein